MIEIKANELLHRWEIVISVEKPVDKIEAYTQAVRKLLQEKTKLELKENKWKPYI